MVKLRLARKGSHKRPFYRVVVAEDSHRRDGRFIEIVGTYDPLSRPAAIEVKADAVLKWLSQGAQPTDTVRRILARSGVWRHWRAVQEGKAQLEEMSGVVTGTVERAKERKPSKKTVAKIQSDEESKEAEAPAVATATEEKPEEAPAVETKEEKPAEAAEDSATEEGKEDS